VLITTMTTTLTKTVGIVTATISLVFGRYTGTQSILRYIVHAPTVTEFFKTHPYVQFLTDDFNFLRHSGYHVYHLL
jgi:hypothetical protein